MEIKDTLDSKRLAQPQTPAIPTAIANPNGLHQRYKITKADGSPTDPRAVYFVLRLDGFCSDPGHVFACRQAALSYCENAPESMKEVAWQLRLLVDELRAWGG